MSSFGHIDTIDDYKIRGWAAKKIHDDTYMRCSVKLIVNKNVVCQVLAGGFRQDLYDSGIKPGTFAFELSLPSSFNANNSKSVEIRTNEDVELVGPKIAIVDGKFCSPSLSAAGSFNSGYYRKATLNEISKIASYVEENLGNVAMAYYLYGVLLNRPPEKQVITEISLGSRSADALMEQIMSSNEYNLER